MDQAGWFKTQSSGVPGVEWGLPGCTIPAMIPTTLTQTTPLSSPNLPPQLTTMVWQNVSDDVQPNGPYIGSNGPQNSGDAVAMAVMHRFLNKDLSKFDSAHTELFLCDDLAR